jgi:hypothetical protein
MEPGVTSPRGAPGSPGEEVLFEGAPAGWRPASVAFYVIFFVALIVATLGGEAIPVSVGAAAVNVPIFVPFLGFLAVVELWRLASFRSTLYVITARRIVERRGVLRVRERRHLHREDVKGVELRGGDPCVLTGRAPFRLVGLGASNLDPVRVALGFPALLAPPPPERTKREALLLVVLGVALLASYAASLVFSASARRARDAFDARELDVRAAIVRAEERFAAEHPGGRLTVDKTYGAQMYAGYDRRYMHLLTVSSPGTGARVPASVRFSLVWGFFAWGPSRLDVYAPKPDPDMDELLRDLEQELGKLGIEAIRRPR